MCIYRWKDKNTLVNKRCSIRWIIENWRGCLKTLPPLDNDDCPKRALNLNSLLRPSGNETAVQNIHHQVHLHSLQLHSLQCHIALRKRSRKIEMVKIRLSMFWILPRMSSFVPECPLLVIFLMADWEEKLTKVKLCKFGSIVTMLVTISMGDCFPPPHWDPGKASQCSGVWPIKDPEAFSPVRASWKPASITDRRAEDPELHWSQSNSTLVK